MEVPAALRAVLHALELAKEDLTRWAGDLTDQELNQWPSGVASVAFHLRHIARSIDRLLTYAEGRVLTSEQISLMKSELSPDGTREQLFDELTAALDLSASRILRLGSGDLNAARAVGNKQLATTLGGLLVHVADHTQRHVGQAITTAKIILAGRAKNPPPFSG